MSIKGYSDLEVEKKFLGLREKTKKRVELINLFRLADLPYF
jgi:hypothetical protein